MKHPAPVERSPEFKRAFLENERQVRIDTGKLACALVVILMPFGVLLDWIFLKPDLHPALTHTTVWIPISMPLGGILDWISFDLPKKENPWLTVEYFLLLRLCCSFLVSIVWYLHYTEFGRRHYRWIGLPIGWLPAFFIIAMLPHMKDGYTSPYYAGLNLILVAVSAVGHWGLVDSLLEVGGIILMYLIASVIDSLSKSYTNTYYVLFINNVYFLGLTGIVVIAGNYLYNKLVIREFELRFELDQNRKFLEDANRKLVEMDQVKSRFFANVSHELRTPLTLLLAPLESVRRKRERPWSLEDRELLDTMHSNGMRLLKLINDLLDLVKLESGKMTLRREPLEIAPFVLGIGNSIKRVATDKRLQLETLVSAEIGTLMADRDKLEKILLNLLFNAVKFTPSGGRITLGAGKNNGHLVFRITDTGIGIDENQIPFVFDRFWQADSSSRRKQSGTGIGLALVKELVEIQGGTVEVSSKPGQGSTFVVELPCPAGETTPETGSEAKPGANYTAAELTAPRPVPEPSQEWLSSLYRRAELFPNIHSPQDNSRLDETASAHQQPKLLVADDEPDMLRFIRSQLRIQFEVIEAIDGQQAVSKASQYMPDVIVCDMMMPEKDGLEVCRELRSRPLTQRIPILLLTARADEETKISALSAGASDFLSKPFSTTELHVRLRNLLEAHEWQKKLGRQNQILEATLQQLKDTEIQLVQSEKMASLGRMSAGIIHEINNPLNYVLTGLHFLKNRMSTSAPAMSKDLKDTLNDLEDGMLRIRSIVSDLRIFTHPNAREFEPVEIQSLISTSLRLVQHDGPKAVRIEQRILPGLTLQTNRNRMIQVLVNLLQNSFYALQKKVFNQDEPTIWIEGKTENDRVLIAIRDNGEGIAAEHVDKIFEPFFTTKDVGEGMGLGLSICYRIVAEHQGRILVKSEKGQFCEFTLDFPQISSS